MVSLIAHVLVCEGSRAERCSDAALTFGSTVLGGLDWFAPPPHASPSAYLIDLNYPTCRVRLPPGGWLASSKRKHCALSSAESGKSGIFWDAARFHNWPFSHFTSGVVLANLNDVYYTQVETVKFQPREFGGKFANCWILSKIGMKYVQIVFREQPNIVKILLNTKNHAKIWSL